MARGLGPHVGAFDQSALQDILDCDPSQGPQTSLTGSADVINPHKAALYLLSTAGVDAMTLAAPTAGADDGLGLLFINDTTNAHTLTCPSALFAGGAALATVATFKAFRGSTLQLRAWNGIWQVL